VFSSLSLAISLSRGAIRASASLPSPPSLSLSLTLSLLHLGASSIRAVFLFLFSISIRAPMQLLSPRDARETAAIDADRHSLSSINLVRGCRARTPRRSDRILNRDDLDDAFERGPHGEYV